MTNETLSESWGAWCKQHGLGDFEVHHVGTVARLRAELASMTEALFQLQEAVRADTARNDLEKVTVAFMEFYKDWKKGDFHLSELAALDAEAVFNAIVSIDAARNPFAKEKKK